jgi:ribosomal protein S1
MRSTIHHLRTLAVAALAATGAGCSQLGPIGDILGGVLSPSGQQGNGAVNGEIRYVDTRSQQVGLRTDDGRSGDVRFDDRTRVIYQQREYPVTALEQGDYVSMRVQQTQQGELYTDQIYVQRNARDQTGSTGGYDPYGSGSTVQGSVTAVDSNRGWFELRSQYGTMLVTLPYAPSAADRDRFARLRTGDSVRAQVRQVSDTRYELVRFA